MISPKKRFRRLGAVALVAIAALWLLPITAQADFGIQPGTYSAGFSGTQAGSHAEQSISFDFNAHQNTDPVFTSELQPDGNVKNVVTQLPAGFAGNPRAYPQCISTFLARHGFCPIDTQVGMARYRLAVGPPVPLYEPIYNMVPPPGAPADLAFFNHFAAQVAVHIVLSIRTGSDYGITATVPNITASLIPLGSEVTIWGDPADSSHDAERGWWGVVGEQGGCLATFTGPVVIEETEDSEGHIHKVFKQCPVSEDLEDKPFLSMPTQCTAPTSIGLSANSWQDPTHYTDPLQSAPQRFEGCDQLEFEPSIISKPTTNQADSPSGLEFDLHIPQSEDPDGLATAQLKDTVVNLPPGLTVNAASANGLGSCSESAIGYTGRSNQTQLLHYEVPEANSFTVSREGQSTDPIPATAGAAEIQTAIEALPGLAGNISIGGQPGSWSATYTGALAGTDQPLLGGEVKDNYSQTVEVGGEGGGFNLHFGGAGTEASFEASFGEGSSFIPYENPSRPLAAGEPIEGPGIAPGTTISALFGTTIAVISTPTTSEQSAVTLATGLPFDVAPAALQKALQALPGLQGNAYVRQLSSGPASRSYRVIFAGALAGTQPATLSATSSLTGTGAGVTITAQTPTPEPLSVTELHRAGQPQFTPDPPACPDDSKIGTVSIETPLLADPQPGAVYLATPHQNPFDSLLALYITVNDPETGVIVKLPAEVKPDPKTGQLTATLANAPQLPFEDFHLNFFKGAGAPLKTGIACGTFKTTTDLTPWSSPEGADATPSDSFAINAGAGGGACLKDEASAPDTPSFEAGTLDATGGRYSPFTLKLARADGTQQITGIDTTLPPGLIGRLAGTSYCPEAALTAAASKTGKAEQSSPSCPASSKVGSVQVGAGAGPTPYYTPGNVYLAGPYKSAPLSLAVITPAVAGPFDLGDVVVRTALFINQETTQIHAVSDPFPSIIKGIPLDLRSVLINLDRSEFTKNPTSCDPFAITGTATMLTGQSSPLSNPFQVGDCQKLKFAPKLALKLKGPTKRTSHPRLIATLTAKPGEANIARAQVKLPKAAFLDNAHIKGICTRPAFATHSCPANSVYGKAKAVTPLLDQPLTGNVYLRANPAHKLPDLVADLGGQIEVALAGKTDSVKGALRNTFEAVPDAPVSSFRLELFGGKRGLIEMSSGFCRSPKASVKFDGQNGNVADSEPVVGSSCRQPRRRKTHR